MNLRPLILIWGCFILVSQFTHAQPNATGANSGASTSSLPADSSPPTGRGSLPGAAAQIGTQVDSLRLGDDGETIITPGAPADLPLPLVGETGEEHPAAYVAAVEFDGDVADGFVDGRLVVEVVVTRNHGWHDLNLNLNQAICRNWEYEGSGESNPVVSPARDNGLQWQFRGIGRHRLTLTMRTPVHRTPTGYQLLLALPPLPREFESRVELRFGATVRVRRPAEETMFRQTTDDAGQTIVTAGVTGPRLDITWEDARTNVAQVAEVESQWTVQHDQSLEEDRLFASVEQLLLPEHGAVESIDVRLPENWEFVSVIGERYLSHEILPDTGLMRVHLLNADAFFQLRWRFSRNITERGTEVTLDGLDVAGAHRQTGDISVETPAGWQLGWLQSASDGVDRQNPRTARVSPTSGGLTFGYQFQPFRLTLELKERLPLAVIRPRWFLNATAQQLELQAEFEIDEEGEPVRLLQVVWPTAAEEGWKIEWINDRTQNEIDAEVDVAFQSGSLSLPMPANSNVLRMRFSRPIGSSGAFVFTLPGVQAPLVEPGWLIQQSDDEVVLALTIEEGRFAADPSPIDFSYPAEFVPDEGDVRPYATEQGPIQAALSIHTREVEASSTVTIEGLAQQWIQVSQEFELDIRYGRLPTIQFLIPDALYAQMQPQLSQAAIEFRVDGKPVEFTWDDAAQRTVELDVSHEPLRGEAIIEARFKFPWDHAIRERLSLPVLAFSLEQTTMTRCSIPGTELVPVIVEGQGWQQVPTAPDTQKWEYAGSTFAIPLAIQPAETAQFARQSVATAFCTVVFQPDGACRVTARYDLHPDTQFWSCELPAKAQGEQFFVGERNVEPQRATLNGRISHALRLTPEQLELGMLRIEYTIPATRGGSLWGEAAIELPLVSESIWIEELFLETILPDGMHLFTSPTGWTQEFQWQRNGAFWTRQPTERFLAARQSLTEVAPGQARSGARYGFSRFGATSRSSLIWMSRPLIVLLGAGITLLLGFLLTRFPVFRGPLPILCLGFAVSIVGIWFREPLELLLQPALMGLVLAWGASRLGVTGAATRTTGLQPRVDLGSQHSSALSPTGTYPGSPPAVGGTQSTIYRPLAQFSQASSTSAPPK